VDNRQYNINLQDKIWGKSGENAMTVIGETFCHGLAVAFVALVLPPKSHGTTVAEHLIRFP
jgi:hypothetical protein